MTLTGTGAAILLGAGLLLLFRPHLLLPLLVFFIPFSCTSVLNVPAVTYSVAPTLVTALLYLAGLGAMGAWTARVAIARDALLCLGALVAFALFVLLSLCVAQIRYGITVTEVTQTVFLLFGLVMALVFALALSSEEPLERALRAFQWSAVFTCLWGLLQLLCFYAHLPYPAFLFNNSISDFSDMYAQRAGGIVRIASVAVEPSFMAYSLLSFFTFGASLAFIGGVERRGLRLAVGLSGLVLLLSTSSTAYFGLALFGLVVLAQRPALIPVAGLPAVLAAIAGLVALPGLREAVYTTTFGKANSYSYKDRTGTMAEALHQFQQHPLVGRGWGTDHSLSIVTQLLASIGVIGTGLFVLAAGTTVLTALLVRRALNRRGASRTAPLLLGASNAFVVLIGVSVASGFHYVTLDMWFVWGLLIALATRGHRELASGTAPVLRPRQAADPGPAALALPSRAS